MKPKPKPKRECLFQEDNNGAGPTVAELYWQDGSGNVLRLRPSWQTLTTELLDAWIEEGVTEVFLQHRGGFTPRQLYRT